MPDKLKVLDEWELSKRLEEGKEDPLKLLEFGIRQMNSMAGVCLEINEHIKESNGHVASIKEEQIIIKQDIAKIKDNQSNLLSRVFKSLPGWAQVCLVLLLAGALAQIGVAIKFLSFS